MEKSSSSSSDPPLEETYKNLFNRTADHEQNLTDLPVVEESELPLIDLDHLYLDESKSQACKKLIAKASREWGFFQVVNHGISRDVLETMRVEQVKLFKKPFEEKRAFKDLNLSAGSYRWGTPTATTLRQLSWSEAFHVSLIDVLGSGGYNSLSSTMEQFAATVSELAQSLALILAEEMGEDTSFFKHTCLPESCYLRLNRYLPCTLHPQMSGIIPHTDSSFLTILHQDDNIGGLQLFKDGKWIAIKPDPHTLIINIGDLFQAWSNGLYTSVEHRVVVNPISERFSTAYLLCPTRDAVIKSGIEPRIYRSFSFGEFKKQVQEDVEIYGLKIGLPNFQLS